MARQQVGYDPGAEALRPTVTPNFQTVNAVSVESRLNGNKGFQLAEALGSANVTIQKWNQEYEAQKTENQARKIPAYIEQFKQDWDGGAVTEAQVRARFPDTVPVIAARVAEGMGDKEGDLAITDILSKVMEDDSLKLDPAARKAFIDEQRTAAWNGIQGKDNEFYSSGFLKAFDAKRDQYEGQFSQQTAAYHQKVQEDSFSKNIEQVFLAGGNIEALDGAWKTSSSIDNLTRNKIVIDTVTKLAFAGDDPAMLDKIPTRFLNADSKKDIESARNQIQSARIQKFNFAKTLEGYAREEEARKNKVTIIDDILQGKQVDASVYRGNPEIFQFALNANNTSLIPEATSAANTEKIRNDILTNATVGVTASHGQFVDSILQNPTISPSDKKKLIDEVPKLIEGNIAMKDPMVSTYVDSRIDPRLRGLENSTNARIQTMLQGRNLRSEVMRSFDTGLRTAFEAEYRDNGKWPTGKRKLEIIDLEVDKAERIIENLTKVDALNNPTQNTGDQAPVRKDSPQSQSGRKKIPVPGMPGVYRYE